MRRPTLVLASTSERRITLLNQMGLEFVVEPSTYEENNGHDMKPHELVMYLAQGKALEVAQRVGPDFQYTPERPWLCGAIIIGADTLTFCKEKPLGKPADEVQARRFLQKLSERPHKVLTGIALYDTRTERTLTDYESTLVNIPISNKDISEYIATGEPNGKAGAYAIQGRGGKYIHDIQGCPWNVVGLPLAKLRANLRKLGYEC